MPDVNRQHLKRFIDYCGLEILEEDWSSSDSHFDFICVNRRTDPPSIVFIDTNTSKDSMKDARKTREEFESAISEWSKNAGTLYGSMTYETLTIKPVSRSHALIRRNIGIY